MNPQTRKSRYMYTMQLATIFIGFIVFGISENIKGPAIPRIQFDFNLDEQQLGTLLSLNALGYLIACSFTAVLVRKWGIKAVSIISFASMIISGVFIYLSHTYPFFASSYFLMYIGNGMLEIALAILGARIFVKNTGTMMNLSHFFYGLSSTVSPLLATGVMSLTVFGHTLGWRGMYLAMLSLCLLPIVAALLSTFPGDDLQHEERTSLKTLTRDPALWMMVMILSFGVVSELAVGGWLVNFLEKAYSWSTVKASSMLSAFFLTFSLGRLLLGPLTDRMGFVLSTILFSAFSAICTFAAIAGGERLAFLFAVSGAGIAMIYPTVMAFIARRYPKDSDTAITFVVTLMGIGSVIGNYVIGWVIEGVKIVYGATTELGMLRGLQAGYGVIGLCAAICAVSGIILYRYLKKRQELI
ncbi:MFS transporter [Paenibacillus sp. FSL L8-0502]|uniref:MFS transporter n=1 Tax=Paenibacillus sp. FSL L8-0502 TaxID=2954619 RepID=UPI0031592361